MSAQPTDSIDQSIKRLQWAEENLGGIGREAASAILKRLSHIFVESTLRMLVLLNSMRGWFSPDIDESIAENERKIAEEEEDEYTEVSA